MLMLRPNALQSIVVFVLLAYTHYLFAVILIWGTKVCRKNV